MSNRQAVIDCAHYEDITYVEGIETGTCLYCGQVKQYVDGEAEIIHKGDPAKARPKKAKVPAPAEQMPTEEKEEVVPGNKVAVAEAAVPPRPKKRRKRWKELEKKKPEIIYDYPRMTLIELFKKYHMSSGTWGTLKREWEVPSKGKGGVNLAKSFRDKRVKRPSADDTRTSKEEASKKAEKAAREANRGAAVRILELIQRLSGIKVMLPDFPPFEKTWTSGVQKAWLDAYCRIFELNQRITSKLPGREGG